MNKIELEYKLEVMRKTQAIFSVKTFLFGDIISSLFGTSFTWSYYDDEGIYAFCIDETNFAYAKINEIDIFEGDVFIEKAN